MERLIDKYLSTFARLHTNPANPLLYCVYREDTALKISFASTRQCICQCTIIIRARGDHSNEWAYGTASVPQTVVVVSIPLDMMVIHRLISIIIDKASRTANSHVPLPPPAKKKKTCFELAEDKETLATMSLWVLARDPVWSAVRPWDKCLPQVYKHAIYAARLCVTLQRYMQVKTVWKETSPSLINYQLTAMSEIIENRQVKKSKRLAIKRRRELATWRTLSFI